VSPTTFQDINKLRWRCRRGTLELDLMLMRYLDVRYLNAESEEQRAFHNLLVLEDTDLMRYLMGDQQPDDSVLAGVVELIRVLPA